MATISSASFHGPANSRAGQAKPLAALRSFWRQFIAKAFSPYRPELHYMRGPARPGAPSIPRPSSEMSLPANLRL